MCFSDRKKPVKIIMVFSVIVAIMGGLMIAFAAMLTGNETLKQMAKEEPDLDDVRTLMFTILLVFALVVIAIALLGCCLWFCKNKCYQCTYGILLIPTTLIVLGFGAACTAVAVLSSDTIQDECIKALESTTQSTETSGVTISYSLDIYDSIKINDYMCTNFCPCKPGDWVTGFAGKRTWEKETYTVTQQGVSATVDWTLTDNFTGDFVNFKDCLRAPEKGVHPYQSTYFKEYANGLTEQSLFDDVMDWVKFFEDEFECAGICEKSLFSTSASIEAGVPTKHCLDGIQDGLSNAFLGLGVSSLIAGIFLFFIFFFQYCLWRKFDD